MEKSKIVTQLGLKLTEKVDIPMKSFYTFLLVLIMFYCFSCQKSAEPAVHLLPNNYTGIVFILYCQDSTKEYINDKRLYTVPDNGILFTGLKPDHGWYNVDDYKFYYVDKKYNKVEELLFCYNPDSCYRKENYENIGVDGLYYVKHNRRKVFIYYVDTIKNLKEKDYKIFERLESLFNHTANNGQSEPPSSD